MKKAVGKTAPGRRAGQRTPGRAPRPVLPDLLERIRALNVRALVRAIERAGPAHVEPALCLADGSLATEGDWSLPMRVDFLRRGRESEESDPVSPDRALSFERMTLRRRSMAIDLGPFGWDWMPLIVDRPADVVEPPLRDWFLEWFDPQDERELGADGLRGVVHFVSDPEPTGQGCEFVADLGSAPTASFDSLLRHLANAGARSVRIG